MIYAIIKPQIIIIIVTCSKRGNGFKRVDCGLLIIIAHIFNCQHEKSRYRVQLKDDFETKVGATLNLFNNADLSGVFLLIPMHAVQQQPQQAEQVQRQKEQPPPAELLYYDANLHET